MSVDPRTVTSPLDRLSDLRVIHWTPDWSLAIGFWDRNRALLIRWNGDSARPLGNPVSHARPTWFVLPDDLWCTVLCNVEKPNRTSATSWLNGGTAVDWKDPVPGAG